MSKFSTAFLIRRLNQFWQPVGGVNKPGVVEGNWGPEYKRAIVARLKAADNLCVAAEGLTSSCTPELYDEYYSATKSAVRAYKAQ